MEDYFHNICENSSIRDTGTDLNATSPDISGCVQSTLLMWMPCGLFWLFLPNYISSLISRKDQPLPSSTYHISAKKFITWLLCVLTANELVMLYGLDEDVMFELKSASIPPVIRIATFDDGIHTLMSALIYWGLVVVQFILHCFAEKAPVNLEESNGKKPCPEVHASFLSKLSFQWMNSLIIGGYEKPITEDDIWDMRPQDKAKAVVPEFEELWNQEMEACKRMLITFIETKTNEETWKGYVLACSFYLNAMVTFGLVYNNDINMDGLIMKLFTTLTTAIYKKGTIGYVPQQAWIQNAKLRDNILFCKQMNQDKYNKVIKACSLTNDLEMLAAGDKTEIGEKGINLSGGQKQRVNLARAVYHDADIYLLDDPLSAVDSHVGKHIFEEVVGEYGLLKDKTRVLVTHGVHWLPKVDQIIVMRNGEISEIGTYSELLQNGKEFSEFLKTYSSAASDTSEDIADDDEKQEKDDGTLIEDEESETGQVKLSVFVKYFQAFGNWWFIILCLVAVLKEFFFLSNSVTLSYWTEDEIIKNHTLLNTTEYKYRNMLYIAMYAGCGLVGHVFDVVYALIVFLRSIVASRQLHGAMLKNILRCPMSFFDTTPVARILNRFTSDIDTTDHSLPHHIRHVFLQLLNITVTLVVITYNTPLFITVIIPATFLYRLVQKYFVTSIRQLERLRSKKNSPMISHVGESISGVSTIRAYGKQDSFIKEHEKRLEMNVMCLYIVICAHKWLGLRLEAISYLFVFGTALFSVMSDDVSSGVVGLCMAFILQITGSLNGMVHNSVRLETSAIGIERIKEYTEKETEAALLSENKPSSSWPSSGNISIKKYQTRYRSGLDLVLKGIDCEIKGGERVGVVGRTGAGKSSLMSALFRLIEATDGRIEIDGRDISTIGLHDLRNKLTILPQTLLITFPTAELWTALEHAHLKDFVKGLSDGLKYECGEGGQNLSVGQRQLVCLARALLYKTKILILDEATAAVDMETDDLIQKTIRTEFKDCTVMAIAHRLNTIMDYDK
ncbi:hypothetical protein KUTeg_013710 [Tegillarca granosa]|uniref:Multidrug resistance-associated protein 1 n=1 Tax=Tegillarca granosa TaxID=220873 RepID=A0ABQ9EWY3_TEGGR|nr:hypothetical protein KUTeg_013710 [Tegillarca granosa]